MGSARPPLVLILADGMPAGGTERQIVELLKGLRGSGTVRTAFGVLVKGGEREKEAMEYADLTIPVRQSSQYDCTLALSLVGFVRQYKVDLIHTFGSISDFSGVVAGKITGCPVINGSIRSARPRLNRRDWISRFCMVFVTWIVANSRAGIRAFGVEKYRNTRVIYNGVERARFSGVRPVTFGDPSICMVGNFTRKKDQAALIRALPVIRNTFPSLQLVLVGRGENLDRCRQLSGSLGLEKCVHFVTDSDHPEPLVKGSTIGVLLSPQGEGISNVIIEYMALEKPVVATDMGGNPEIVESGRTGILVPDHSVESVARPVIDLLSNPEKMQEMGRAGRKVIEQRFDMARMIHAYEDLYEQLLRKAS